MFQRRWLQNQGLKGIALTSCLLGLSLGLSSEALAGYKPPNPSRPRTPPGSWASRGCETQNNQTTPVPQATLTLLAPHNHIGATTSTHPTFAWFIPEQRSYPVEFMLFEYSPEQGRGKPIIEPIPLQSSPGIMQLSLPTDQPGLTVGKTYIWQVALICSRNRPSKNPWMEAIVQVVQSPTELQAVMSTTADPLQRSQQYAQAGFWYDALAEALKAPSTSWKQLLIDLSKTESSEQQKRLQAITGSDRP